MLQIRPDFSYRTGVLNPTPAENPRTNAYRVASAFTTDPRLPDMQYSDDLQGPTCLSAPCVMGNVSRPRSGMSLLGDGVPYAHPNYAAPFQAIPTGDPRPQIPMQTLSSIASARGTRPPAVLPNANTQGAISRAWGSASAKWKMVAILAARRRNT